MKYTYIYIIIFLVSCSPIFIPDAKLNDLWIGENYEDIVDILGPYTREIEDLSNPENNILIWEASKDKILIPIEKLGTKKNKLGTSISSLHVYINNNGYITNIKKSVY